jgi:hypothetical protein
MAKTLSQDSLCADQDSNWTSPEYKLELSFRA